MARNHSRSSARTPARPSTPPQTNQTRSSSTTAAPPHTQTQAQASHAPVPTTAPPQPLAVPQQQGIFSQIATTAAGVAAGHVAGRMITNLFSGGGESAPAEAAPIQQQATQFSRNTAPQCQEYSRLFLQCMDQNGNQIGMCNDYMEMMKACQQQYAPS